MVVRCDANHEHVRILVLNLTIDTEMLITGGIVDLDLDLLLLDVLDAPVDIEYGRFVILGKAVVQVVRDQARLTDSSVSCQDELQGLLTCRVRGPTLSFGLSFTGFSCITRGSGLFVFFCWRGR